MALTRKTKRTILAGVGLLVGGLVIALLVWIRLPRPHRHGAIRRPALDVAGAGCTPSRWSCTPVSRSARTRWSRSCKRLGYRRTDQAEEPGSYRSPRHAPRSGQSPLSVLGRAAGAAADIDRHAAATSIECMRNAPRRGRADLPPRSAADRQHLSDPRRRSRRRDAGRGAPRCCPRRSKVVEDRKFDSHQRRGLRSAIVARRVGSTLRAGTDRAGRLDAHATAGEKLLPRQSAHARPQARGSDDGHGCSKCTSTSRT
mgnify:CR=1 FL=1